MAKSSVGSTVAKGAFALLGIFLFIKLLPTLMAYFKQLLPPSGTTASTQPKSSGASAGGGSAPSGSNTQGGKGTSMLPEPSLAGGNLVFGGSIPQSLWDFANSYPQEAPPSLSDIFNSGDFTLNDNPGSAPIDTILNTPFDPLAGIIGPSSDSYGGGVDQFANSDFYYDPSADYTY